MMILGIPKKSRNRKLTPPVP